MPYNFDFKHLKDIKTIEVNPKGWVVPITIEYGIAEDVRYGMLSYFWRVKGTAHTFVIPVIRMDFLSSGDYQKHYNEALENFREDYMGWHYEGFSQEWQREYRNQFSKYIIV